MILLRMLLDTVTTQNNILNERTPCVDLSKLQGWLRLDQTLIRAGEAHIYMNTLRTNSTITYVDLSKKDVLKRLT